MRKLTDIINSLDQYNGLGPYSDEYKGSKEVDVQTEIPNTPKHATVSETMENQLRNILGLENISERNQQAVKTETFEVYYIGANVLSFEEFIAEKRGVNMPSNVQSYFGDIDEEEDVWEEE